MKEKILEFIKTRKTISYVILAVFLCIIAGTGFAFANSRRPHEQPVEETVITEPLREEIIETEPEETEVIVEVVEDIFIPPDETKRPFAVLIDNEGTKCLPQGGIYKAQIVYEIIVEGGESRLMPVFWFDEEDEEMLVGPVRSARHYMIDFAMEHDSIFVHFGWSPKAITDIAKFKVNNINGVSNGGWIFHDLTNDPYNWQDSYTYPGKMIEYIKQAGYRTEKDDGGVFRYNETTLEYTEYENADEIVIKYSPFNVVKYEYNSEEEKYYRFRKDAPHMERNTDEQFTAKNIIIRYTRNYTISGDKEGRQEVITTGSGQGHYITMGKVIPITWEKDTRLKATVYRDLEGEPISLNPGQTWVQVVPLGNSVTLIDDSID